MKLLHKYFFINFFVFEFRGLQKNLLCKVIMAKNIPLKIFFCLLHKNYSLFCKKYLLSNFLPRGHTEFFDFTHFGNVRHSIFIPHWNFEWSSKNRNVLRFDQCVLCTVINHFVSKPNMLHKKFALAKNFHNMSRFYLAT